MNTNLIYNGVVTLTTKVGNKIIEEQVFNNGTNLLFELYARALTGQKLTSFLPTYISIGEMSVNNASNGTTSTSYNPQTRSPIPVVVTYISATRDDPIPHARVEAVITKNMFSEITESTAKVCLLSSNNRELAHTDVQGLSESLKNMASNAHMILVWDLYVSNKS